MGAVRKRVVVRGRVQGVFFRDSCRGEAVAAKVAGSVRNLMDGQSVEVVLEGEAVGVDRVLAWCRVGPSRAVVTGVEITDEPPVGELGFRIR